MSITRIMSTIPTGLFFSKVLVVLGFVTLVLGTIGGFIVAVQTTEVKYSFSSGTFTERQNVTLGLTMIVSSLVMSSLMIVVGSYVDVRLSKVLLDMTPRGIQQQDSSLSGEQGQALTDSDGQSLWIRLWAASQRWRRNV